MAIGVGVLGCGSVFEAYAVQLRRLEVEGRIAVRAAFDPSPPRRVLAASLFEEVDAATPSAEAVLDDPSVDAVLVLTSMNEHGPLARAALEAGKHVLVEKPMATTLEGAERVLTAARDADRILVCAPHVLLSPTYRAIRERVLGDDVGRLLSARARYGWQGPEWARWFYEPGGGSLFDLGVYNVMSLCGLFGPVRRVTAMVGTAVPRRVVEGEEIDVRADDTAHVLLDFGGDRFAVVTTGFVIQNYRSPAIELYGERGVLQLLGDDWAPNGFERWDPEREVWEIHAETAPTWPWTDGANHLVACIENDALPVTRPEHAFHVLEVMLAAKAAGADGRARTIESDFPAPDYDAAARPRLGARYHHDPRNA